jgi:hypothetical protein
MRTTLALSLIFLILEGCAHAPPDTKFDGKWQTCQPAPIEPVFCLNGADTMKLKALLDRCGAGVGQ